MPLYTTTGDIDAYAALIGDTLWTLLTDNQKDNALFKASKDMELIHRQDLDSDGNLWEFENDDIIEACQLQSMYLGRNNNSLTMKEQIQIETGNEITKGSINTFRNTTRSWDSLGWQLFSKVMALSNIFPGLTGAM